MTIEYQGNQEPMTAEQKAERALWAKQKPAQDKALAEEMRRQGYQKISDPVFFQWQRGEKTEEDYKNAVAEVIKLYPVPEENV